MDRRDFVKTVAAGTAMVLLPGGVEARDLLVGQRVLEIAPRVYRLHLVGAPSTLQHFWDLNDERHRPKVLALPTALDNLIDADSYGGYDADQFQIVMFVDGNPGPMTLAYLDVHVRVNRSAVCVSAEGPRATQILKDLTRSS